MSKDQLTRSDVDWARAKEIFADVIEASETGRREIFARAEMHDRRLRRVVQRLLEAHEGAGEFLDEARGAKTEATRSGTVASLNRATGREGG